jgi:formylglycine-generating enzyme required for sulfatase activity
MGQISNGLMVAAAVLMLTGVAGAAGPPAGPLTRCPVDAVVSGAGCMDKYEASVWRVPNPTTSNRALVTQIQQGTATAAQLTAHGATPLGRAHDDYAPCADSGEDCEGIYAVSLPGETPAGFITWFQAQQACKNARKRLPSNAEWQAAVAGTPDPVRISNPDNGTTDCHTAATSLAPVATGSRSGCVSSDGAFDMVGNMDEWVAEWVPRSSTCGTWSASVSADDEQCLAGAFVSDNPRSTGGPGALQRGGSFGNGRFAGPLTIIALYEPSQSGGSTFGFRCAR